MIKSYYSSDCPNMDGLYGSRNMMLLMAPSRCSFSKSRDEEKREDIIDKGM